MEKSQSPYHKNLFHSAFKKKKKFPLHFFSHLQLLGLVCLWWASRDKLLDTNKSQPHLVRRGTGPQMFQGQAVSCCLSLEHSSLWAFKRLSSSSSGAMWDATIKLNSLKKTEPTPRAQGSGKRHTVFTQVLSTGPQSITVIPPALQRPSDSPNDDIPLLWLLYVVAVNTHSKHDQSLASQ